MIVVHTYIVDDAKIYDTKYGMKNNKFCLLDWLYTVYIGDYKRRNRKQET